MKLEFLANRIDGVGYHPDFSEHLLVLSDFTVEEACKFRDALIRELLPAQKPLDLSGQYYIELVNCNLLIRLSDEDEGIRTRDQQLLYCDLTPDTYKHMLEVLQPFCEKEKRGYSFLSEEGDIDFLLSPGKAL